MIFYFTGTGNSLHVAREIAAATGDEQLISIPQAIHDENKSYKDQVIGIVCPNYGHFVPGIVKRFVEAAAFEAEYLFVVMTYGNIHGGAAVRVGEWMEAQGKKCNFIDSVKMVDNFVLAFDIDEQRAIDKHIPEQLAGITSKIAARQDFMQEVTAEDLAINEEFAEEPAPEGALEAALQVNAEICTGCGICERICPGGCFTIAEGLATKDPSTCEMCMGCINLCPSNALFLVMGEPNPNARWRNENVTLNDIAKANSQIRF